MKRLMQGHRIVWLVRTLTAVGLIAGVVTIGMIGWMLAEVRVHRAHAMVEQAGLNQAAAKLRWLEMDAENETALDETTARAPMPNAVSNLVQFVRSELEARHDRAVREPLIQLDLQMPALVDLARRAGAWRAGDAEVSQDIREQRTIGRLRSMITELRYAVSGLEGRRRLDDAIRYRRWRLAEGDSAARQAQAILVEQGRRQSQDPTDFNNQLAELKRLAEVLGGEEQFDKLNDLKDNQLKPLLDQLSDSIAMLNPDQDSAAALTPQAIEDIKAALFGAGNVRDDAHQDIQLGRGGLFALRRDALRLRRDREKLKREHAELFEAVEAATMDFAQSAQVRTTILTQQMEQSLAAGWRRSLILGGACRALFLWLAWLISRGIQRQVIALEKARVEAETARQTTESLMIQQRESERRKAAIIESALDCIITINEQGRITEFNPSAEKTFGHSRSQVMGKLLDEVIISSSLREQHRQGLAQYLATGQARVLGKRLELSALRADGIEFPIELAISRVELGGGQAFTAFIRDITQRKIVEAKVEAMHKELLGASRQAGMAEVATGILHNVGNVLNSVNVSASVVADLLRNSCVSKLGLAVNMLTEHAPDLGDFLGRDQRGSNLTAFLAQLANHLNGETRAMTEEMQALARNLDHVKEIVSTQQAYAGSAGFLESLDVRQLFEDALRIHAGALARLDVVVVRKFEELPPIQADKHKLMQILVNLISNAKHAMTDSPAKTLTLKVETQSGGGVRLSVCDTGYGIAPENMTRIFAHGFTTKQDGHGFGLHSSALAAREMKGSLRVHSDGPGAGAVFILGLPPAVREAPAA